MEHRPFLVAMFDHGPNEWSWEFTAGYLAEAIAAFNRGVSTTRTLAKQARDVETAVIMYEAGRLRGLSEQDIADALRRHANSAPLGSDSPSGEGSSQG
jgi:hypothetical protein